MSHIRATIFAMGVVLAQAIAVQATTFSDTFNSNPFIVGIERWCERFPHVHWDSGGTYVRGANGSTCTNPPGVGHNCSSCSIPPGIGGHFLITTADYGGNTRSAETVFALPRHLGAGSDEHIAIYDVTHPVCHAGYQVVLLRELNGTYTVQVAKTDDVSPGFPECGQQGGVFSAKVTGLVLSTSTTPRYKMHINTSVSGTNIVATGVLTDMQTGTVLTPPGMPQLTSVKPIWYNGYARRYGVGGSFADMTLTVPHDNFVGTF
jgi:hypothetical protein